VLNLVRHGPTNRRIAELRETSIDATRFHVANILRKLDARDSGVLRAFVGAPADSPLHARSEAMPLTPLGPIGQIAREVADTARSERFYRDVLGLPHLFTFGNLAFFDCGGTRLMLTTPEGGAVHPQSAIYLRCEDIVGWHAELSAKGVVFVAAPHLVHRYPDGAEEWMAFFRDPDGHLTAVMERTKPKA
jgi:catechol 2,3-dioxygenase-like lactoylglutathione lyase family enzyme